MDTDGRCLSLRFDYGFGFNNNVLEGETMNGSKVKKLRKEIVKHNKLYADDIYKLVSDAAISALFHLPLWKRFKFAVGLFFLPLLKGE